MEFKEKEYDGLYEVCGINIHCENEIFNGVIYYPPETFKKPHPLIIYFHGFPQLFTLQEIVKQYTYLLDMGYAFLAFNFRGYRYSQGKVSIKSQLNDAIHLVNFVEKMSVNAIFDINNVNIIAHDFGAYIALVFCSTKELIKKMLLISPILDLKQHVYDDNFKKMLYYINRFLPGHVKGVENVEEFIEMTKKELSYKDYQIESAVEKIKLQELEVIIGQNDDITPLSEVNAILKGIKIKYNLHIIEDMGHECAEDEEIYKVNKEIEVYFRR